MDTNMFQRLVVHRPMGPMALVRLPAATLGGVFDTWTSEAKIENYDKSSFKKFVTRLKTKQLKKRRLKLFLDRNPDAPCPDALALPKLKLLKDVTDTTAMSVHIHDLG